MPRACMRWRICPAPVFSDICIKDNRQNQGDAKQHAPLTRFSGLCSSCVVEAQRVMRDLNMQPTTTASILWAKDLLSPVVKLFPKPALSGSNREAGESTDHTGGGLVSGENDC